MISIAKHMDEYDIAQEVRLERRVHKGSFLLLEGDTDIKRFSPFVDEDACSFVNCYGRPKAVGAIRILYDEGFVGALAIIDADFDRITGSLEVHEGLVYSASHDLDLDWATPTTVDKYLRQVGDPTKLCQYGPVDELITKILIGLTPVSIAKLLNHLKHIKYKLSDIDASECFEGLSVDIDGYVELILRGRSAIQSVKDVLKQQIKRAAAQHTHDLYQLTNGHDFHCALGASLRSELGSRRDVHTWGSEVEMHLRLAFSDNELKESQIYEDVAAWVRDNASYKVFHSRLAGAVQKLRSR